MITRLENPADAAELFETFHDTMVLSCLSGMMGDVYAVAEWPLCSAVAVLGDFSFFAGQPSEELLRFQPAGQPYCLLTPQNDIWAAEIRRVFGKAVSPRTRYAFYRDASGFVPKKLQEMAALLPEGVVLSPIDDALYVRCLSEEWARDFVSNYESPEAFARMGVGFLALRDGEVLAGASSYSSYPGGIEIEIDTRKDQRRQGLARACGARLMLECLERGLYPSWDAANKISVHLAETLGYRFREEYTVYQWEKEKEKEK